MVAASCVELVKVVVSDAPLNRTTEVGTKPEPVTVSAIGDASPAVALAGAIVVTTTLVGFATVKSSGIFRVTLTAQAKDCYFSIRWTMIGPLIFHLPNEVIRPCRWVVSSEGFF